MLAPGSTSTQAETQVSSHRTSDIEEHAQEFSGWQLLYDQITPGRFEGSITQLQIEGMQLVRDRTNQSITKKGAAWPSAITFSLPLSPPEHNFYCAGHTIEGQNILVAPGQSLPELTAPADIDLLCVAVEQPLIETMLRQQNRVQQLESTARCYRLNNQACLNELSALVDCLTEPNAPQRRSLLAHQAIREGIRDTLLMHLLDLVDSEEVTPLTPHARKKMVDRACEYALAHPDNPPSIVELCNQVGASRRKLQYCFQEALGINPVAYLRTLRLNAVRRALLSSEGTTTVQDIASQWGFWHLSRFAGDYRRLFGELPSDTLKRN